MIRPTVVIMSKPVVKWVTGKDLRINFMKIMIQRFSLTATAFPFELPCFVTDNLTVYMYRCPAIKPSATHFSFADPTY